MRGGSVYLVVRDFARSLDFYEKLFESKVDAVNGERFAVFNQQGLNLCLMSGYYDVRHPEQKQTRGQECPEYDRTELIADAPNTKKVFINLWVPDLETEYRRIRALGIAEGLTPIRYLHVFSPYWYFSLMDPDGNPIEITGGYEEESTAGTRQP